MQTTDPIITSLAVDDRGTLYAGAAGSGKVYRVKSWRGHHLEIKSSSRTRRYAGKALVDPTSARAIQRLLPNL